VKVLLRSKAERGFTEVGAEEVKNRFGVLPNQLRDFLAMVGDKSDNIPGIDELGPVTAARFLNTFGDGDSVFRNLDKLTPKIRAKFEAGRDSFELDSTIPIPKPASLGGKERLDDVVVVIRDLGISAAPRRFLPNFDDLKVISAPESIQGELF